MLILVEQNPEDAKKALIDAVYQEAINKSAIPRSFIRTPDHAPDRVLKASEAGKRVTPFTEIQLKQYQEAHSDHIDQGDSFLGCPYCDGRLEWDREVLTPAIVPDDFRDTSAFEYDGPTLPVIEVAEIDPPEPIVIRRRRPRAWEKPSSRSKEQFLAPLREVVASRVLHPTDQYGFIGVYDSIHRDYGTCTKAKKDWNQLSMSPRNRQTTGEHSIYFSYLPRPMVHFARWLFLHLYPEHFTAYVISPPPDAYQFTQYAWDILKRSEAKLLLYGLALPTTAQVDAVLQSLSSPK